MKEMSLPELMDLLNDGLSPRDKIRIQGNVLGIEEIKYQYPKTKLEYIERVQPDLFKRLQESELQEYGKLQKEKLKRPKGKVPTAKNYFFRYHGEFSFFRFVDNVVHTGNQNGWQGSKTNIDVLVIKPTEINLEYRFTRKGNTFVHREYDLVIPIEAVKKSYLRIIPQVIIY